MMRFFKYSLIFVLSACALISALPAAKTRKSLKRSTEVTEALPKVEEAGEPKDNNRTKKQTTTFCVEIKGGQAVEKICEPQIPQEPQKVPQSTKPESETYLVFPPAEPQDTISYVQVPVVHHHTPSLPQLIVKPGGGHGTHDHQPPPSASPPAGPNPSFQNNDCTDTYGPGSHSNVAIAPNGQGSPSIVLPGSGACTCLCPGGPGPAQVYASFMRNSMGEQQDMMLPGMESGMDARNAGMMMMPGMDSRTAGMMMSMGMDPMAPGTSPMASMMAPGPSAMGPSSSGMAPAGPMDMRTAQLMESMTDPSGTMPRTRLHHYHHYLSNLPAVTPQPMQLQQPIQLNQPYVIKCGPGGFRTSFSDGFRNVMNGNQGMMAPGGPATGDMQNMGPAMEMQRTSHQQMMPQIVVTPSQSSSHLHPGHHAGNPCNEGKAKHWQIRSTDAGAESNGEASVASPQEVSGDSSARAQLTPSQMLNQMRGASPAQRMSPVMQNDNNESNVQMSVIGPGGQSYPLGGGRSSLDGAERREELSKREAEVSNNKLEE